MSSKKKKSNKNVKLSNLDKKLLENQVKNIENEHEPQSLTIEHVLGKLKLCIEKIIYYIVLFMGKI